MFIDIYLCSQSQVLESGRSKQQDDSIALNPKANLSLTYFYTKQSNQWWVDWFQTIFMLGQGGRSIAEQLSRWMQPMTGDPHHRVHQRRGHVAEGVNNNDGCFHQKCQNFWHHVRNFLWPNLRLVLERNFFRKTKIVPEMYFLLFLLNINVAVQPFIGPPVALYLPCSITSACLPPSCHFDICVLS